MNEFWGLSNPLPVGNNDIQVVLQNQGTNLLTSATIYWQVNGIAQTPIVWNGYLAEKEDTIITIGSYNFPAGKSYQLKAWTADPNTLTDCNTYNDTINVFDLATPLCGVYTIGGVNPDFPTFYDASVALNNAGVACPVIFKVRNGSYNEQIKLYDIPGASLANTVLFEGENADSTLAEIHYQLSNPSNDFTISLTGADYITFQKMGIRRTNGTYALLIQNNAHHVTAQNCRLGNVISPNTSCDSVLTFRYNNLQGFDIILQHPDAGPKANAITVENNFLNSLVVNNSSDVSVRNNRNNITTTSYAVDFTIDKSRNILVENNRMRRLYMTQDTTISVLSNNIYESSSCCNDIRGILVNESLNASISANTILNYNYGQSRGIDILNSKSVNIINNSISVRNNQTCCGYWAMGVYINGGNTRNVTVRNNTILSNTATIGYGIYMDAGDSIFIKNNTLSQAANPTSGTGISCYNILSTLEVDSNTITGYLNEGIRSRPTTGSNWKIRYNTITNIQDAGIFGDVDVS